MAISQFLNQYPRTFTQPLGSAEVEIKHIHSPVPYTYQVDVQSIGEDQTGNRKKTITQTFRIEIVSAPEQLKYAVGATGDLFLHGAASIVGDIYVRRNLITVNKGYFSVGSTAYWQNTDRPSIESLTPGVRAGLTLGGKIYRITNTEIGQLTTTTSYQNHSGLSLSPVKHEDAPAKYLPIAHENIHQVFKLPFYPEIVEQTVFFSDVPIAENRSRYLLSQTTMTIDGETITATPSNATSFTGNHSALAIRAENSGDITIQSASFNRFSTLERSGTKGKITINGTELVDFGKGAFIDGDVNIKGSPKIRGPLFITGNLTIDSADVQFDSTIYVLKETEIKESKISGMRMFNPDGTPYYTSLVLFGKQKVRIYNTNLYLESPLTTEQKLRAFLYSEEHIEIFGVGSNISIVGGIFGRNVIFNAVKGNTYGTSRAGYIEFGGRWFEPNQTNIPTNRSRLRIEYNKELIQNPPPGLPPSVNFKRVNTRIE